MLDFDNPAVHQNSWSANYSPANHKPQSYYPTSPNPMHPSDCPSPRFSPSFQWKPARLPSSPSFVPSPRPEQLELVTSQTRRSPVENGFRPVSPFRSVRRMKKPFELKLPASPRSSSEKEPWSPPPSRERGLRPWRSDQNLAATRLESSGLPPSPPLSTSHLSNQSPTFACFLPKTQHHPADDQAAENCDDDPPSQLYNYSPDPTGEGFVERQPGEFTDVHMPHRSHSEHHEPSNDHCSLGVAYSNHVPSAANASVIGENVEVSRPGSERRAREATVSSDAGWIPNNLSYFENWLQGVPGEEMDVDVDSSRNGLSNRRKFQIVQKCPSPLDEAPGEPVTFAVASKTKPKLVNISPKSSPPMSYSDASQSPRHPLPCIPDPHQEISSFSPDTSNEPVDGFRDTYFSFYSSDEDDAVECMDTASMHSDSMGSTAVCEPAVLDHDRHGRPCSPANLDFGPTIIPPHKPQPSPGGMECMTDREQLEKWWDHEWTLDQLEYSVKDFPRNMLRLTSPVIMFLRHNSEQALLRPFRNIFPDISENLLDSLSAGLIARNYVVALSSNQRNTRFLSDSSLYGVNIVPDKAMTTLGIHVPRVSQTQIRDRIFGSRSAQLRKNLDKIVDYLLFAICGRSDETLKSAVVVVTQVLEANA